MAIPTSSWMRNRFVRSCLLALSIIAFAIVLASGGALCAENGELQSPVPPGTEITPQNWQNYQQYMTAGMAALFSGKYFWKFPPDFKMVIAPTTNYSFPKLFLQHTEQYSKQVNIVNLPDGRRTIKGYVAGLPFPNPTDPLKGWKLLVDDWYTYAPRVICAPQSFIYNQDRFYNRYFLHQVWVIRKFSHISDPGAPIFDPRGPGTELFEYTQILAPEQIRYLTVLTVYYDDISKPQDTFLFIPALRRSLRLSTAARCSPFNGSDYIYDDTRHGNFNGNLTLFDADYLGERMMLEQAPRVSNDAQVLNNLNNYYQPLLVLKPQFGAWEIRKTWVINVHPIPSYAKGYCISKRILFIDQQAYSASLVDRYDVNGKLWKPGWGGEAIFNVPGIGRVWTNGGYAVIYDLQAQHMGWVSLAFAGNQDCRNVDGVDYTNIEHFSSLSALASIMR